MLFGKEKVDNPREHLDLYRRSDTTFLGAGVGREEARGLSRRPVLHAEKFRRIQGSSPHQRGEASSKNPSRD